VSDEVPSDEVPSDEELIAAIPTSAEAFDTFYRRHIGRVVRFLARRCPSPEDVADATASTFLAVLGSCSSFRPERGSGEGWLLTIARNQAHRQGRDRGRQESITERLRGRQLLSVDDAERIAEMIDAERDAERLCPVIASARPSELELLDRMVADDLSPAEASRALGIAPGAGRLRLTRLRNNIRVRAGLAAVHGKTANATSAPPEEGP
jgi:RNA polymerase sigma factor (sigma-70 family)